MQAPRILVPLNGSHLSEAILPYIASFGSPSVTLVRAVRTPLLRRPAAVHAAAEKILAHAADGLRESGLEVTALVLHGDAAEVTTRVSEDVGADLIALTTHGRSGWNRARLGSVAETVIRWAKGPVLCLRTVDPASPGVDGTRLFERVLVAYDGSDGARRAIEALARFGAAGRGRVTLVSVLEADVESEKELHRDDLVARYVRERRGELRAHLAEAEALARSLGLDATSEVCVGRAATRILERAAALDATLIAMGSRGRGGISRLIMGSVAETVLRGSWIPLLICK